MSSQELTCIRPFSLPLSPFVCLFVLIPCIDSLLSCMVSIKLPSIMLYTVAEVSHAGYLVENLKPPDLNEPGLEGHFSGLDVKCYLPGKLYCEEK